MCYQFAITTQFKKDLKKLRKQGKDKNLLDGAMTKIINKHPLEAEYRNHPLKGNWIGSYDCHIQPDWVLICTINNKNNTVVFERTGSHSEVLKK